MSLRWIRIGIRPVIIATRLGLQTGAAAYSDVQRSRPAITMRGDHSARRSQCAAITVRRADQRMSLAGQVASAHIAGHDQDHFGTLNWSETIHSERLSE